MSDRIFMDLLAERQKKGKFACGGLDSDTTNDKFPKSAIVDSNGDETQIDYDVTKTIFGFNKEIVTATADLVACYKINIAFYAQHGEPGLSALRKTIALIKSDHPEVPVIVDAKRGDIGNTNLGYVNEVFENLKGDAVTVPPYMGMKSLSPFLDRTENGIFVLAKTSNPGAGEFQDLMVYVSLDDLYRWTGAGKSSAIKMAERWGWEPTEANLASFLAPLHQVVALRISRQWNANRNVGIVAGATNEGLETLRLIVGRNTQILIPGIGAQGGDLEKAVVAASQDNSSAFVLNVSRSYIFASSGTDYAQKAREYLLKLNSQIANALKG